VQVLTIKTNKMKNYLTTLIEEKGKDLDTCINLDGHFGLTYGMLIDYVDGATQYHNQIKTTLVKIDFMNGDVFHYLDYLANGMVQALGY
jgi:hypothetical protein|tara:strand:- start:1003 stop:1269 length:267 start_codon:yes stop_codon:yes gene_type:complete